MAESNRPGFPAFFCVTEDPKCLRCHVTGTISDTAQRGNVLPSAADFEGVQCEMCHGVGKL